ncbi:MAG: hypothetical protein HY865_26960 [Chloroflexi bacterium]|nr:hypothetical protein [Chloroflexota bacterium]
MKLTIQKLYNGWTVLAVVTIFSVFYLSVLHPWMNRWGITDAEAAMNLPGDGEIEGGIITSTRGVTINASSDEVWKWIVQLGQERAGFYSEDWLENLTLADIHNADEIRIEWQQRQQGEKVLGAGGAVYGENSFWRIPVYEEGKVIYLWGSIVVLPVDAQTSRLVTRSYTVPASPVMQTVLAFTYDWMHFVMERGMLLGIKARAEQTLESGALLRTFSSLGWILATLGIGATLFMRRHGWGLISLAYAVAIIIFTRDLWSAMAGFLWLGIIVAGFILWGRGWWKGLLLSTIAVILVFVLTSHPHTAFGVIFLLFTLATGSFMAASNKSIAK